MEKKIANGKYTLRQVLGTGSFGKVYLSSPYAIKEISMALPPHLRIYLDNQIKILMSLNHPNIVKLIEIVYQRDFVYIVMEYCEEDLTKTIKSFVGNEDKAKEALRQIIVGFKELTKIGIVHRDLKPANILVSKGVLKLADFGLAKFVENSENSLLKSCVGTPLYMAPQILRRENYSPKCDVWSVGVIFYEMLFGRPPWTGSSEQNLLHNILSKNLTLPNNVSEESKLILVKMLAIEENDRFGWEQVFKLVLKTDEPNYLSVRRFAFTDLRKMMEIELKELETDPRTVQNILNSHRKQSLSKQEQSKLYQILDLFDQEYHNLILDYLSL